MILVDFVGCFTAWVLLPAGCIVMVGWWFLQCLTAAWYASSVEVLAGVLL
jgi:hypothetical protein